MQIEFDFDDVIKIINDSEILRFSERTNWIKSELKKLAYGKTWKCLNCGGDIYFNKHNNKYQHCKDNFILCNANDPRNQQTGIIPYIAIPTPDWVEFDNAKTKPVANQTEYIESGHIDKM
jgi:hypothetical protein